MKLFKKALAISFKKMLAYPYEIYLVALYSAFSIAATLLFWRVLFSNLSTFGYQPEFIYLLSMAGLFSDGLCEFFFGLRDLDYLVQKGEFDRYLIRPRHPMYLLLLENIPLTSILEELALSLLGITAVCLRFQVRLHPLSCLKALGFLLIGVVYYELVYGLMTVLSLRMENISSLRDLVFQLSQSKQYPLSIFPRGFKLILTHIIPVGLLAYYPTVLLLDLPEKLPKLYLTFPIAAAAAVLTYRRSLAKYSSNGG